MSQLKATYGGIEFVVGRLFDALVEHGLEVELFCASGRSGGHDSSAAEASLEPRTPGLVI